jgi:hypothetical protein
MISFSIDKQRGQVNAEGMSRPVDTKIKIKKQSTAGLGLDIHGAVTYFCFSTEKKLLRGPIIGGAYTPKCVVYVYFLFRKAAEFAKKLILQLTHYCLFLQRNPLGFGTRFWNLTIKTIPSEAAFQNQASS